MENNQSECLEGQIKPKRLTISSRTEVNIFILKNREKEKKCVIDFSNFLIQKSVATFAYISATFAYIKIQYFSKLLVNQY